jgi:hypothetical protein
LTKRCKKINTAQAAEVDCFGAIKARTSASVGITMALLSTSNNALSWPNRAWSFWSKAFMCLGVRKRAISAKQDGKEEKKKQEKLTQLDNRPQGPLIDESGRQWCPIGIF